MHAADGAAVAQDVRASQVAVVLVGRRPDTVALGGAAAFGVGGVPHAGNNYKIGLDFIPPNVLESFLQSNAICGSAGIGRQARLRCVCL